MLYSLSGVPREAFARFPMPRNTAIFAPTFRGEGVVRSDDIKADPRYGHNAPNKGMPEGHLPVTSHLAVPVISREGEVIGGLFRSEEHTSELQSLMRISYAVFCLKKKTQHQQHVYHKTHPTHNRH